MFAAALFTILASLSPVRTSNGWHVGEHNSERFDAHPPQIVSVLMFPDGTQRDRCAQMGGQMFGPILCQGVDY